MKNISSLLTGCLILPGTLLGNQLNKPNTKPNIILILADDLGYGDLSCYGQQTLKTPNIDRMAREGIRFVQHYTGSSVCAPSRASLMTGRDPGHCWVRGNYETGPHGFGGELELRKQDVTLAEILKRTDYQTAIIGKWGLGMDGTTGEPKRKGFDYSYGFLNQAHAHEQFPDYLYRNGESETVQKNLDGKRGYFSNDIFTDDAIRFLKKKREAPFFLYLAYITPHAEMLVPEDSIFNRFKGKFIETPFIMNGQGSNESDPFGAYYSQSHPKAAFASMITRIDYDVKKILDELKNLGLDKNTLIIFSSDNGPHQEGGNDPYFFNSNGSQRGIKRDLYEGGIRVPFIVRWPDVINPGQVSDHLSAFWDILPTFADLVNVNISDVATEGISLLPTFLGNSKEQKQHPYLYWEFHENKFSDQAVRKGKWKAIRHDPDAKAELYNLEVDPKEKNNLASTNPEVVNGLEKLLDNSRIENPFFLLKRSGK